VRIISSAGLAALATVANLLTACAAGGSETGGFGTCVPVVEYSREFQVRAAEELELLPEQSAVAEMLVDYSVMRDQGRACEGGR
jgi:methylthioribose-1-phosphate isomerase